MSRLGFAFESSVNESQEWYTPPYIFDALGVKFDLDPCSPEKFNSLIPVPAANRYTKSSDGLKKEWFGRVWLNPPYGRETGKWLSKLIAHGNGIALVYARVGTAWFDEGAACADCICLIRNRIHFLRPDGSASGHGGCGSVLFAYGRDNAAAVIRSELGLIVIPQKCVNTQSEQV